MWTVHVMRIAGTLAIMGMLAVRLAGQQPPARVDVTALGPQVGQQVPDFRLIDHRGKTWTRDSIMGPNGAMLVFARSADW
jgi:hypothetical protein